MIKTFEIKRLTNPAHLQFMNFVVTLVEGKNPTTLNVKPQHDELKVKLIQLKDLYKTVQAHPLSERILQADILRDTHLSGITRVVDGYTYHYQEATKTAAEVLMRNIKLYGSDMGRNDYFVETAKIESMVGDWRTKPELVTAAAALQLSDWITQLEAANNEFQNLYAMRTEDYSQETEDTMAVKRLEVNAAYDELCKFLNSHSVINSSNPDYAVVIAGINAYVDQMVTFINQRGAHATTTTPPQNP